MQKIKIISVLLVIILVINMILLGLGKIPVLWFWIIMAVIALFAYKILPGLKK